MKKLLIILSFLTFMLGSSQDLKFEEIVSVDSTRTKEKLFNTAKLWIAEKHNNSKAVIQTENINDGIILGKVKVSYEPDFFSGSAGARGYIGYTLKLSFKDGKYRFEMYDFEHFGTNISGYNFSLGLINDGENYTGNSKVSTKSYRNRVNNDVQNQVKNKIIPFISKSFKDFMVNDVSISNENNDW